MTATVGPDDDDGACEGVGGEVLVGWADPIGDKVGGVAVGVAEGALVSIMTVGTPTSTMF